MITEHATNIKEIFAFAFAQFERALSHIRVRKSLNTKGQREMTSDRVSSINGRHLCKSIYILEEKKNQASNPYTR